jgi:hypothetical protein
LNNVQSLSEDLLDIGNGLKIELKSPGIWKIVAKNGCFDLIEPADFWRVVILLERPYSEIESIFNEYVEKKIGVEDRFPYWKVVSAGLDFKIDQWASLALTWFPYLEQDKKNMLGDLLENVANSKWASQKTRQLASRYIKQMHKII